MERSVRFRRMFWGIGMAAAMLAMAVGVRAFAGPGAPVPTYTGCLHKNGTIVDVALGDQPAAPCGSKATVHLGGGDITAVNTPAGGGLRGGGTSGDVSLSLAPIPAARVKASMPLAVPDNTLTVLPLDFEEFDTADLHDPADNTRLTAPVAGIYTVSAHVSWPVNPQGSRELFIDARIGLVFQRVAETSTPGSGVDEPALSVSTIVQLSAGDYVQLEVRQTGGLTDSVQDSDHSPTLTMAWLGPSS
jgi:hypothetical protein